jgi:hypothetical protein
MEAQEKDEILTGVFYIDTQKPTFIDQLNVVDEPLATLPESLTRPPKSALDVALPIKERAQPIRTPWSEVPARRGTNLLRDDRGCGLAPPRSGARAERPDRGRSNSRFHCGTPMTHSPLPRRRSFLRRVCLVSLVPWARRLIS